MYRLEKREWERRVQEEKVGIVRISVLVAVLVVLVLVLDSIGGRRHFSVLWFALSFAVLFGLIAGLSFSVCSIIRNYRSLPYMRTAVVALFYMAFPIVFFTYGIICFILKIGPFPI